MKQRLMGSDQSQGIQVASGDTEIEDFDTYKFITNLEMDRTGAVAFARE